MSAEPDLGHETSAVRDADARVPVSLEALRDTVAAMLDEPVADVGLDDDLILDWGLDSMRVMTFVERLRATGMDISILDLAEQPTISAWQRLLAARAVAPPSS